MEVGVSPSAFLLYLCELENKHTAGYSYKKFRKYALSHSMSQQIFSEKFGGAQNCDKYNTRQTMVIKLTWAQPLLMAV